MTGHPNTSNFGVYKCCKCRPVSIAKLYSTLLESIAVKHYMRSVRVTILNTRPCGESENKRESIMLMQILLPAHLHNQEYRTWHFLKEKQGILSHIFSVRNGIEFPNIPQRLQARVFHQPSGCGNHPCISRKRFKPWHAYLMLLKQFGHTWPHNSSESCCVKGIKC